MPSIARKEYRRRMVPFSEEVNNLIKAKLDVDDRKTEEYVWEENGWFYRLRKIYIGGMVEISFKKSDYDLAGDTKNMRFRDHIVESAFIYKKGDDGLSYELTVADGFRKKVDGRDWYYIGDYRITDFMLRHRVVSF